MRVLLTFIAVAAFIGSITYALPAQCENCLSGMSCWGDSACGQDCSCIRINGIGKSGVCG